MTLPCHVRKPGRLRKRPEFLCVKDHQVKWIADSVVVQIKPNTLGRFRYGVTATKKIGNAVTRNKAKRRLRAAMDHLIRNTALQPVDCVLIARHTITTQSFDDIQKNIKWCLKRLEVL